MLIKSQDGKQIVNMDNCIAINSDEDNRIVAVYPIESAWDELGRYSSDDKAQKVLGWILNFYTMNRLLEVAPETMPRDLFDEYVADQVFGVFQMPSDEEVVVEE